MTLFEQSPERYAEQYINKNRQRISRNMAYGSKMAEGLEAEEATGDPLLDLVASKLPKYERMDKPVEMADGIEIEDPYNHEKYKIPFLRNGKELILLYAKPDSAKSDYSAFF